MAESIIDTLITRFIFRSDKKGISQAEKDVKEASARMKKNIKDLGTVVAGVGTALAGLGAASIAAGRGPEEWFFKLRELAGVTADEVEDVKEELVALSSETAQPLASLAEGMFSLRSNQLSASDASEALNIAAKGAAIGLGEVNKLAGVASSAIQVFGDDLGGAERALNTIFGMIRAGKIEDAGQAAKPLTRTLQAAGELGMSMEELGASFAVFSRGGTELREIGTQLATVLRKMLMPTAQAKKIMAEYKDELGRPLSPEIMREWISAEGLAPALQRMRRVMGAANLEDYLRSIGSEESVSFMLDITGQNAEDYLTIRDEIEGATGQIQRSFDNLDDTAFFAIDKALNNISLTLNRIYEALQPVIKAFGRLPEWMQTTLIGGGVLLFAGRFIGLGKAFKITLGWIVALSKSIIKRGGLIASLKQFIKWSKGAFGSFLEVGKAAFKGLGKAGAVFKGLLTVGRGAFAGLRTAALLFGSVTKTMFLAVVAASKAAFAAMLVAGRLAFGGLRAAAILFGTVSRTVFLAMVATSKAAFAAMLVAGRAAFAGLALASKAAFAGLAALVGTTAAPFVAIGIAIAAAAAAVWFFWDEIVDAWAWGAAKIKGLWRGFTGWLDGLWDDLTAFADRMAEWWDEAIVGGFLAAWDRLKGLFGGLWDGIKAALGIEAEDPKAVAEPAAPGAGLREPAMTQIIKPMLPEQEPRRPSWWSGLTGLGAVTGAPAYAAGPVMPPATVGGTTNTRNTQVKVEKVEIAVADGDPDKIAARFGDALAPILEDTVENADSNIRR